MRTLVLAVALAAACGAQAAPKLAPVPGFESSVLTTQVDGMIEVDRSGRVIDYTLEKARKPLPPKVVERLMQQVRGWAFEPVQVDGKPVVARTRMRVTLLAEERPEGFAISIDNVTFPPLRGAVVPDAKADANVRAVKTRGLRYPDEFLGRGLDATVLVSVKLRPDGTMEDAAIVQTSIPDRTGKPEEFGRLAALLEAEVLRGVKRMQFAVDYPEGAKPLDEPVTGMLPIVFHMGDRPKQVQGLWRVEARSIKRTPPWVSATDGQRLAGVSDLNEGESANADGGLRLKNTVNGVAL